MEYKKGNITSILLVIIVLCLIGANGVVIYNKITKKDDNSSSQNTTVNTKNKKEVDSATLNTLKGLIDIFDNPNLSLYSLAGSIDILPSEQKGLIIWYYTRDTRNKVTDEEKYDGCALNTGGCSTLSKEEYNKVLKLYGMKTFDDSVRKEIDDVYVYSDDYSQTIGFTNLVVDISAEYNDKDIIVISKLSYEAGNDVKSDTKKYTFKLDSTNNYYLALIG